MPCSLNFILIRKPHIYWQWHQLPSLPPFYTEYSIEVLISDSLIKINVCHGVSLFGNDSFLRLLLKDKEEKKNGMILMKYIQPVWVTQQPSMQSICQICVTAFAQCESDLKKRTSHLLWPILHNTRHYITENKMENKQLLLRIKSHKSSLASFFCNCTSKFSNTKYDSHAIRMWEN